MVSAWTGAGGSWSLPRCILRQTARPLVRSKTVPNGQTQPQKNRPPKSVRTTSSRGRLTARVRPPLRRMEERYRKGSKGRSQLTSVGVPSVVIFR